MAAPVNFSPHVVSRRTLLKELIRERARRDCNPACNGTLLLDLKLLYSAEAIKSFVNPPRRKDGAPRGLVTAYKGFKSASFIVSDVKLSNPFALLSNR